MNLLHRLREAHEDTKRDIKRTDLRTKDILLLSDLSDVLAECADEIEGLRAELEAARRTAEYWKANHLEGNEEIEAMKAKHSALEDELDRQREAYAQQVSGLMDKLTTCQKERDELVAGLPDLSFVIAWLANGCNVQDAIAELKLHQAALAKLGKDES